MTLALHRAKLTPAALRTVIVAPPPAPGLFPATRLLAALHDGVTAAEQAARAALNIT